MDLLGQNGRAGEDVRSVLVKAGEEEVEATSAMAGAPVSASPGFVGRARELERLTSAADAARAGRGSMLLVVGEAGIGKTRLAEELAAYSANLGFAVLWATCREEGGAPAYFPWRELFRDYAERVGPDSMEADVDGSADLLAGLLPGRAAPQLGGLERVPGTTTSDAGLDPDASRFRLFEAVADVIGRAAARDPLLLVLDDLHWADVPSLLLLRFVLRDLTRRPALILGTYRGTDVDWEDERGRRLAELGSPGGVLRLGGLNPDQVGELMATVSGAPPSHEDALTVHDRAGGNPLFVLELASLPSELWKAASGGFDAELPSISHRVRAVLEHRLGGLGELCVDALEIASVIGNDFSPSLVARVMDEPEDAVLGLIDEAAAAGVVVASHRGKELWRFRHGLVRDLVYTRLGPERRRVLHRLVAETLEQGGDGEARVGELSHHFLQASSGDDTARAVHYCEAAGRQAMRLLAYEEATEHFDRALQVLEKAQSADPRPLELLLLVGDARIRAGDVAGARVAFVAAAEEARRRGRTEELARAALGFGAGLDGFEVRLFDQVQLDLLEEALEALGTEDSSLRAWVLARLSVALSFVASSNRRQALSAEAVAVGRRLGDDAALAHALASRCDAIAGPGHAEQRLEDATEIVRLARAAGDRGLELLGRRLRVVAAMEVGDVANVDAEIDEFARTATAVRQPLYQWYVPLWRAMRAIMEGRFDDAERYNATAGEIGARAQSENAGVLVPSQRFLLAYERGDLAEAERGLRAMSEQGLPMGYTGRAWMSSVLARQGRLAEAHALVERLAANDIAELPEEDAQWLAAVCQLADACAVVGAADAAELIYRRLLPHRSRFAVDGIADACVGSVERYLGLLAASLGRYRDAEQHFTEALAVNRAAGSPLLAAHVLRDHGATLGCTDPEGDTGSGLRLLGQAIEAYRDLGADGWVAQTERHLVALGASRDARPEPRSVFLWESDLWTIEFAGTAIRLPDAKGLGDIARLLRSPGTEVHSLELVGGKIVEGDTGATIDARARDEYRARLSALESDLEDAEAANDLGRAEAIECEREFLLHEISAAFGLGGRVRRHGDAAERARAAVAWRIRDSLKKIERVHPALGRHLRNSLRTGVFCSYHPEQPVDWQL